MTRTISKPVTRRSLLRWPVAALALAGLMATAPRAQAAPVTFATFNQVNTSVNPLSFTNNTSSGTLSYDSAVPINFNFTSQSGLSTVTHQAIVQIAGVTNQAATGGGALGALINQQLTGPNIILITDSATGKNLLTVSFTGAISGHQGANNAQFAGDQSIGDTVTFSSDFLTFAPGQNSFTMSLGNLSPTTLSIGAGGLLNSFLANMTGQFTAGLGAVPAPASVVTFSTGLAGAVVLARWRRKRLLHANQA